MWQSSMRLPKGSRSAARPLHLLEHEKAGKTISRKLSVDEAKVLEQWVANRQEVKQIVDRMMTVSQQAFELVLKNKKTGQHRDQITQR
jgi:hypothetical protein